MRNNEEILNTFEKYLAQIQLPEEPQRLYEPIIYSMSGGGKRIRPALCCSAARLSAAMLPRRCRPLPRWRCSTTSRCCTTT